MLEQLLLFVSTYKVGIIVGVIATVAASIIIFLFRNLLIKIWQLAFPSLGVKKQQDSKLWTHFMELKTEAESLLGAVNNMTQFYGVILVNYPPSMYFHSVSNASNYNLGVLSDISTNLVAHFPKETADFIKSKKYIAQHNKRLFELNDKVKQNFELMNISVLNANDTSNRPFYIYDSIYKPLFQWWQDRNKEKPNNWINFNKIGIKAGENPDNLYVDGSGAQAIAHAKTDGGKRRCRGAIRKISHDTEYQKEVFYLSVSADIILTTSKETARQLKDKLYDVENFWRGTKKYKFKKEKRKCLKCKEIFG